MTDWNPAEIVGTNPKRLASSLYRYLVTDEVWARQRAEYGYRDVRPCPLLVDFVGHPYVDVRASFNSFVPAALPAISPAGSSTPTWPTSPPGRSCTTRSSSTWS